MAIAGTNLTTSGDVNDLSSYATASITPTTGRLVVIAVVLAHGTSVPALTSVSGAGLTFTQRHEKVYNGSLKRLVVLTAPATSPTTEALTITPAGALIGCMWSVDEVADVDLTNPVVQSVETFTNAATLASFADATNHAAYGAFARQSNTALTEVSPLVRLGRANQGTPGMAILSGWHLGELLSVDASDADAGIAMELRAAAAARPTYAYQQQ